MKPLTRLLVLTVFSISLLVLGACGKDSIPPYEPSQSSGMPDAKDIEYTSPVYSEEMAGPSVESLESQDGQGLEGSGQLGSMGQGFAGDQESDEYKKTYGRSSQQMLPIYFDFDQASIRSDQFSRLDQNADYLKNNPSVSVVVQGNCDERGTNEYNLALGERRALNAKTYLLEMGVEEYRIRTVSYGEERPLFMDQDEFSWAQNRRDDFILE